MNCAEIARTDEQILQFFEFQLIFAHGKPSNNMTLAIMPRKGPATPSRSACLRRHVAGAGVATKPLAKRPRPGYKYRLTLGYGGVGPCPSGRRRRWLWRRRG